MKYSSTLSASILDCVTKSWRGRGTRTRFCCQEFSMPNILKSMVVVLLFLRSDFERQEVEQLVPSATTSLDETRTGVFNNLLFMGAAERSLRHGHLEYG